MKLETGSYNKIIHWLTKQKAVKCQRGEPNCFNVVPSLKSLGSDLAVISCGKLT